jgi:Polyketide cyclase / dehydrase and lipid transport
MIRFEESVVIERPPAQVFAFVSDPRNDTEWTAWIVEVRQTSVGPLGVGASFVQGARFLRRRLEVPFELTAYEPNRKMALMPTRGPVRLAARRSVEPGEAGTRVTIEGWGQSGFFLNLLEPLIALAARRRLKIALVRLKHVLEQR